MFAIIIKALVIVVFEEQDFFFFRLILALDYYECSSALIACYAYLKGRAGLDVPLFSLELKQENRLLMSGTSAEPVKRKKKNRNFNPTSVT